MSAPANLVTELKAQVLRLEDDLRARVETHPDVLTAWQDEHRRATAAERTASSWQAWRDDRVTQAAVAWVLTTVFIRFCEDNSLLKPVWISGPPERRQEALDAQNAYFRLHPTDTNREWLLQAVTYLGKTPATRNLVDSHSALWAVSPSGSAVTKLLDFWRERGDDGALLRDFADPQLSTRFLGDLYQDLSEHAKNTYALLQTPEFVEEFILDQTMEPALAGRPLEGFLLIDPACGSGHFLLGALQRLLKRWDAHAPAMDPRERVQLCLNAIHGVDLNPFAVAITRFRLTLAALQACGETSLERAPGFRLHVEAGDSLLHGHAETQLDYSGRESPGAAGFAYGSENLSALQEILHPGRYDVVVGNPPYITVRDKSLNQTYRSLYKTCSGKYALTVPFMELFYELAKPKRGDQPAGWTGQITSNSFMKREFGSKIIEDFLAHKDLVRLIDTSGAYIPGHGTPTAILIGRNQKPVGTTVRTVLGIRGEPGRPHDPALGMVWRTIVDHIDQLGYEDEWVSIANVDRTSLSSHPWSLSGGGADQLSARIWAARAGVVGDHAFRVGIFGIMGSDDAMMLARGVAERTGRELQAVAELVLGDSVRDFAIRATIPAWFPYTRQHRLRGLENFPHWKRALWPLRTELGNRATFTKGTYFSDGRPYYEWHQLPPDTGANEWTIAFAEVTTHNHFALDRGGQVFNRSAPVIKLPAGASEDEHLALLGILNSSTICFQLREVCGSKGGSGIGRGIQPEAWMERYNFNSTNIQELVLPELLPLIRGRLLDLLAQESSAHSPRAMCGAAVPTFAALHVAEAASVSIRGRMIAQQEELDWECYRLYGIVEDDLTYTGDDLPELALGERAFEIALARKVAAGEEETAWFARHGSTPITEIPEHWTVAYRELVQRRLELMASDRFVGLLERPEYKRRWASEPWRVREGAALRDWLLDRLEDRGFWFDRQGRPAPVTVGQLADRVARDADLVSVLALWEGRPDAPVVQSLTRLLADEAVPFLAAYRLKDSGLRKREAWEQTWALQRREDAGEKVDTIPVPPKYTTADFRKLSYWQARGKLDVPKERFILYPDAGRSTDPTPLLGWAGWDHAQQALALATIIGAREAEGAADAVLVPLVAGLAELQPWVEQWHADVDPTYGVSMATFCREELSGRARQVGHSLDQLHRWRPAAPTRGRKPRS